MENPQTIGNHIRNRRLELKLTLSEAAQLLGVHLVTLGAGENDRATPMKRQLPKIQQFLGYELPALNRQVCEKAAT